MTDKKNQNPQVIDLGKLTVAELILQLEAGKRDAYFPMLAIQAALVRGQENQQNKTIQRRD